ANQAYAAAIAGGLESQLPTFPAFLGLCMLDNLFVSALGNPTPEVKQIVSEFGIVNDPPSLEWQIANRFVKNPQFKRSTKLLMEGDNSSWGPGGESGGELALFWPGKAERAIP
ncbi:MAG TPA: hypothetical protein VGS58_10445, partial [Candidatus Sulfopaludibacter sp.]|nr:hypothetical protein [Candidatus Sulfopaludibacter sp.]